MSDPHQPWTSKYRPTDFDSIQGNNAAIDRLKDWAKNFPEDTTPRLLAGPPGTGKTTVVEVIADWLNLQLLEINASSARKKADVEEMASVIGNYSADGERRVILLDELDSWHSATDKSPLYDALDDPPNLVFGTCNDEWETPDGITRRCETEDMKLGVRSRKAKLRDIAEAENLDLDSAVIDRLAERPDLRSAINDLQIYGPVFGEAPEDARQWDMDEWDMVDALLTGTPDLGGDRPRDGIRPGEAVMWLDENIKHEYRGLELVWAYEALSRADVALMQDAEIAQEMVKAVAKLRLTEPYYDDNIGRKKSFPEWFRHSKPTATDSNAEARLYRAMSNYEDGSMGITQSYSRFREVVLPYLQDLPKDERCRIALTYRLDPGEFDALDLTEADYEGWIEVEDPEVGDGLSRTEDASAW